MIHPSPPYTRPLKTLDLLHYMNALLQYTDGVAIRLQLENGIAATCDTAQEAADLLEAIQAKRSSRESGYLRSESRGLASIVPEPSATSLVFNTVSPSFQENGEFALRFLRKIGATGIDTYALAEKLECSPKALSYYKTRLKDTLGVIGLEFEDVVIVDRNSAGGSTWKPGPRASFAISTLETLVN